VNPFRVWVTSMRSLCNIPPSSGQIWRDFFRIRHLPRRWMPPVMSTLAEMLRNGWAAGGNPGTKGIFANYGRTHVTTPGNTDTWLRHPVFDHQQRAAIRPTTDPFRRRDAEFFMINEIKRWTPHERPAFLHVFLSNWLTDWKWQRTSPTVWDRIRRWSGRTSWCCCITEMSHAWLPSPYLDMFASVR